MGKLVTSFSTSLDGFVADPNDDVSWVFRWYNSGDIAYKTPDDRLTFNLSPESLEYVQHEFSQVGAIITGRRLFDITQGWGGQHTLDAPVFVLTHNIPEDWDKPDAPFTFVTDGLESAVAQAQAVAGDKSVAISSADVAQQAIRAGLMDEIGIDLVPVFLGQGIRYFDLVGIQPVQLELIKLVNAPGVTHLKYRIIKNAAQ